MNAPENPPAFPNTGAYGHSGEYLHEGGMTLRDWFAGQALAGMMSNENTPFCSDHAECEPSEIAAAVFEIADAMLAARANGGNQ